MRRPPPTTSALGRKIDAWRRRVRRYYTILSLYDGDPWEKFSPRDVTYKSKPINFKTLVPDYITTHDETLRSAVARHPLHVVAAKGVARYVKSFDIL